MYICFSMLTFILGIPNWTAVSNTTLAIAMAKRQVRACLPPLPIWNETPMTSSCATWATFKSNSILFRSASYLEHNGLRQVLSFVALIWINNAHFGWHLLIFLTSSIESKVIKLTPTPAAYLMWDYILHGLAKIILSDVTPRDMTDLISARLEQSKLGRGQPWHQEIES